MHSSQERRGSEVGRNALDSKSSYRLIAGTWVRIPPSPPEKRPIRSRQVPKCLAGFVFFTSYSPIDSYPYLVDFSARVVQRVVQASCTTVPRSPVPPNGVFMSGINNLTDRQIKNLKPRARRIKIGDGDKLWLFVSPSGIKVWRMLWKEGNRKKPPHLKAGGTWYRIT